MTKTFTEWLNEKEEFIDEAVSDAEVANFTKGMNVKDLEAFLTGHFNRTTSHPLAWTMVTKNAKSGAVALFNQKNSGLKNMNSADAKLIEKLVRAGMAKFVKITDPVLQDKHGTDWNSSLELTSKGAGLLTALQKKNEWLDEDDYVILEAVKFQEIVDKNIPKNHPFYKDIVEDILKRKKVPAANLKFALNDIEAGKIVMAQTDHSGKHHEAYRFDYGIAVKINKHTQVAIQRLIAHKYAIFDPTNPQVEDKHGYDVGVQLFTTPKFVQLRMLLDKPIKESLDEAAGSKMRWRSDRLDRDRVVGTGSEFHDSFLADNAANYKEMQAILKDVKAGKVVITGTIVHPSEMTSVGLWNSSSERMSRYTGKKLQIALDMLDEGLFYATKLIEKKAGTIDAKPVGYLAKLTQWGKELEGALPALIRKSK